MKSMWVSVVIDADEYEVISAGTGKDAESARQAMIANMGPVYDKAGLVDPDEVIGWIGDQNMILIHPFQLPWVAKNQQGTD